MLDKSSEKGSGVISIAYNLSPVRVNVTLPVNGQLWSQTGCQLPLLCTLVRQRN